MPALAAKPSTLATLAPLTLLLLGVGLLVFGTNLQGVLLPILGHERGSGMLAIGLFSAGWSIGFALACLCVGVLLGRLGHVRAFAALALLSATSALLLSALPRDLAVIALRVVIGFCYGGLSAIIEGWLMAQAGSSLAFATYMIVNLLASLAGTLSLNVIPTGRLAFVLTAAAVATSLLPVTLTRVPRPPIPAVFRPRLGQLVRASPVGALGCLVVGLITGALGGLGPIFGMLAGLSMRGDTLMLAANSIGGALAYTPIGWLAGRVERPRLVLWLCVLGIAICLPLVLIPALPPLGVILVVGALGFAQYPLYGLCVGIANAELSSTESSAQVASELLLVFGLGTIAGPIIAGQIMRIRPDALFVLIASLFAVLAVATMLAMRERPARSLGRDG